MNDFRKITVEQMRAARGLLNWRAVDLAEASGVGVATIRRAEGRTGETGMLWANEKAVIDALEAAGVQFVWDDDDGGAGVRFRK